MNDLPKDLAHPKGERTHLIANISVGVVLLGILFALLWYAGQVMS
jgi:hypothetical protein